MARPKRSSVFLILIALLVVLALVVFKMRQSGMGEVPLEKPANLAPTLLEKFRAEIAKPEGVAPREQAYAMIELARAGDQTALPLILQSVKSPDVMIRQGAAKAVGFFEGKEAFAALETLLNDPDSEVRNNAILSACQIKGGQRALFIDAIGDDSKRPAVERIAAWGCELRAKDSAPRRAQIFEKISEMAKSSLPDRTGPRLALALLLNQEQKNPKTGQLAREVFSKSDDPVLVANSLNYLAAFDIAGVGAMPEYLQLFKRSDVAIRAAAVASIPRVCPEARWQILGDLMEAEKDEKVRVSAILTTTSLDLAGAKKFFKNLHGSTGSDETKAIQEAKAQLAGDSHLDSCELAH
jgi:HEAT repeat protein